MQYLKKVLYINLLLFLFTEVYILSHFSCHSCSNDQEWWVTRHMATDKTKYSHNVTRHMATDTTLCWQKYSTSVFSYIHAVMMVREIHCNNLCEHNVPLCNYKTLDCCCSQPVLTNYWCYTLGKHKGLRQWLYTQ